MSQCSGNLGELYTLSKLLSCSDIKLSAWHVKNGQDLLVLYTRSGYFIYYYFVKEEPVIKHIPWFRDPHHAPVSIDFSPSGVFLLVLGQSCNLYILPVLPLFESKLQNDFFDLNDLTIYTYPFSSKSVYPKKVKSKSPSSSLTVTPSLSLQSSSSSLNGRQRSWSSSSGTQSDSQGNENMIKLKEILGLKHETIPSAVSWWQTLQECHQIGIIGTKTGDIIFVDLLTGLKIGETSVRGEVRSFSLCQDSSSENTFLLITVGNDEQYKLMLEQKNINYILSGKQNGHGAIITSSNNYNNNNNNNNNHDDDDDDEEEKDVDSANTSNGNGNYLPSARARLQGLKQLSADKLASLKQKIAETRSKMAVKQGGTDENLNKPCGLLPENLGSVIGDTLMSSQRSHDGNVLAGYYAPSQILTVHSMNLDVAPLFIHKMPLETDEILLCDRVIYVVCNNRTSVQVISSKLTETWIEKKTDFNTESVLGKWDLKTLNAEGERPVEGKTEGNVSAKPDLIPEGEEGVERIVNIYKSVRKVEDWNIAKAYNLEKTSEELPDIPKIENCVVVTNRNVYLVELKANVVKMALDLILETQELEKAERISTIFGIHLQKLLELAGDIKLAALEFPTAIALYKISKCGLLKSIVKLACGNHCSQVLNYSTMLMANSMSDMSLTERIHLSNLILMAYTQQILKNDNSRNLMDKFLEFLETNCYFDEVLAVSVTGQSLLFSCLHKLMSRRGLIFDGFNVLIKLMERFLNSKVLEWSLNRKDFWKCATEPDLIEALVAKPSSFQTYAHYVSQHLDDMESTYLESLLNLLDPTSPCVRPVSRMLVDSEDSDNEDTRSMFPFAKLVELFILVLLVKIKKERSAEEMYDRELLIISQDSGGDGGNLTILSEPESFGSGENLSDEIWPIRKDFKEIDQFKKKLENVLSCGFGHSALIRNGSVFVWGQAAKGCLGQGPTMSRYSAPTPISWFSSLKLEVSVVSCGKYHTAALTNNGLYTWGSSRYGQLGLGDVYESPYPRLVTALANENVITVACGQYHTVAMTGRGSVYAWGWGVHGQLGLGSVDDQRQPQCVEALKEHFIVDVAAGHGHSLVLSDKGHVYAFGSSVFGQLGTGTTIKNSLPVLVKGINGKVVCIATGYFHNLAVTETNVLYSWGSSPQCLRFQAQARKRSRLLQNQQNPPANSTESDSNKQVALETSEEVSEEGGLLDKAESEVHLTPSVVDTSNVSGKIIQISCGCHHSALVTDSGGLYTWGRSIDGQLGNGGHREVLKPTLINETGGFKVEIARCGCEFTAALEKKTGKVFCWGSNSVGQLAIPIKESATKSLDGKLVMLKSCKRIVRLLDRNAGSNSVDSPREVSQIPPPIFTYETLRKNLSSPSPRLSSFDPERSHRSLHFVVERYGYCVNLPFVFNKCVQYNNFYGASKICLLQNKCKQSMIYQLKALQNLSKYRSRSASYLEKQRRPKDEGRHEPEIKLFTVEGGREDMCDESRFPESSRLAEDDVDQNAKGVEDPDSEEKSWNRLKLEYADHAKYILNTYLNLNSKEIYEDWDSCAILETGIQFWTAEKLPMSALESFFLEKLDEIYYDLGYLLFCQQRKENQGSVLEEFSTGFLLKMTSKILNRVEKNESCVEYLETMSKMVNERTEGKPTTKTAEGTWKKKSRGFVKSKRPKSETYLEAIRENLKHRRLNENYIKISYGDVIGDCVFFFSCGHYHSTKSLKEECKVFDEINDEVLASKLVKLYEGLEEEHHGDLACPLCVRNYLRQYSVSP